MIIKNQDYSGSRKTELEILKGFNLPWYKAEKVSSELKNYNTGKQGEKNTAYYLDFYIKDSENWMIIHDLRLEHGNQVAQIDHLIITRALEVYVIETKTYNGILKMNDDYSFQAIYGKRKFNVESPIEQNNRHIELLKKVFKENNINLKRMGINVEFEFHNIVALDPKTEFIPAKAGKPKEIIKSDQLITFIKNRIDEMSTLDVLKTVTKIISSEKVQSFAKKLSALHKPTTYNYKERFNILDSELIKTTLSQKNVLDVPKCKKCSTRMVRRKGVKGRPDFFGCGLYGKGGCTEKISINDKEGHLLDG